MRVARREIVEDRARLPWEEDGEDYSAKGRRYGYRVRKKGERWQVEIQAGLELPILCGVFEDPEGAKKHCERFEAIVRRGRR